MCILLIEKGTNCHRFDSILPLGFGEQFDLINDPPANNSISNQSQAQYFNPQRSKIEDRFKKLTPKEELLHRYSNHFLAFWENDLIYFLPIWFDKYCWLDNSPRSPNLE